MLIVVLEVKDPQRSLAFYGGHLALEPVRAEEFAAGKAPFPSVRTPQGSLINFLPPERWRTFKPRNPNHLALRTTALRLRTICTTLGRLDIPVTRTQINFGAGATGWSAFFKDPDGVGIELMAYRKLAKEKMT